MWRFSSFIFEPRFINWLDSYFDMAVARIFVRGLTSPSFPFLPSISLSFPPLPFPYLPYSFLSRQMVWGSAVSSPGGVLGGTPATNAFWRIYGSEPVNPLNTALYFDYFDVFMSLSMTVGRLLKSSSVNSPCVVPGFYFGLFCFFFCCVFTSAYPAVHTRMRRIQKSPIVQSCYTTSVCASVSGMTPGDQQDRDKDGWKIRRMDR